MKKVKDMSNITLDEVSAKFYLAFKALEREDMDAADKPHFIDVFANYLFPPSEDDYVDGELNELSPAIMFIAAMLEEGCDYKKFVYEELEKNEDYELLNLLIKPVGKEVELVIDSLTNKQIEYMFSEQ